MARRVIATAEVQVAADVGQAEAGLNGLTEAFRQIGSRAERAAERAEAAFFQGSTSMQQGFRRLVQENEKLINQMLRGDQVAQQMGQSFRRSASAILAAEKTSLPQKATQILRLFKEVAAASEAIDRGLHDAEATSKRLLRESQKIEGAFRAAAITAERIEDAIRDAGRAIDVAMAGGMDGLQGDIRETVRRLNDLGGEFAEVGAIGRRAFDDILDEFPYDVDRATDALFRLQRRLGEVQRVGDDALDGLAADADRAADEMGRVARNAERADRSMGGFSRVTRRSASDVRSLTYLLGAGGLGYAMSEVTRFGLGMTDQLDRSGAAFLGLTGSIEGANETLEKMVIFARDTPYNLANVTTAAAQLLAVGDGFGVTAKNVDQYLETFGNALTITGGSEDQFVRIVRVLGQMSSTGKVLGQDMNQLAQNLPGFNVWEALAEGANTSVTELRRLQDLGQLDELLTGNEAVEILIAGMKNIPGAAGAMERRMNTLGGALEKFRETAQLSVSQGLQPFADTAQDILSDPVILRSVDDLGRSFGSLLSSGLEDIAPEFDDLAAAIADLFEHMESWGPVVGHVTDALGDFVNAVGPVVDVVGSFADSVLGFGSGLGKVATGLALFKAGPLGIAAGSVLAVSGAMDMFNQSAETAANTARLLAAAQGEVNLAMQVGEEEVLSEAQQLALDTAQDLIDNYPLLAARMAEYGVSVEELRIGMTNLAAGTGEVTPEVESLLAAINSEEHRRGAGNFTAAQRELQIYQDALEQSSKEIEEALENIGLSHEIAALEVIGAEEDKLEAQEEHFEQLADYYESLEKAPAAAAEAAVEAAAEREAAEAEAAEKITKLLEEQVAEYNSWKDGINSSVDGAKASLSSIAEEADNSLAGMTAALQQNTNEANLWQNMIVEAGTRLSTEFSVPQDQVAEFMRLLGEMGMSAAPAVAEMLESGEGLEEFFNATVENAETFNRDLVGEMEEASGSGETLVQGLADGTLTVDEVLEALPEAVAAAGLDMETEAGLIDLGDDFTTIGEEAVAGLIAALEGGISRARAVARSMGQGLADETGSVLQVRSPSRVMYEIGEYVVEGLIQGVQSMDRDAWAAAEQTASMLTGALERHFKDADDPKEAARRFASEVAQTIVDELVSEQEAVADAAAQLVDAATQAMDEAWAVVEDRFQGRDIQEGVAEAQAEIAEARAELAAAQALAGASGVQARAEAERRVAAAERALAAAEAVDDRADLLAEEALISFGRETEDLVRRLERAQGNEIDDIQNDIDQSIRWLDHNARLAAEAEMEAAVERHEEEMIALDRRREDEERLYRRRLDSEDEVRESLISQREDELRAFERALEDIVDSIADAVADIPGLTSDISDAQRDAQDAYLEQFERLLANGASGSDLQRVGGLAGLTETEIATLIGASRDLMSAQQGANSAQQGIDILLDALSSGLFVGTASGGFRIADGLSGQSRALAESLFSQVNSIAADQDGNAYQDSYFTGRSPLVSIGQAVFQDGTDAELVAQAVNLALAGRVG